MAGISIEILLVQLSQMDLHDWAIWIHSTFDSPISSLFSFLIG